MSNFPKQLTSPGTLKTGQSGDCWRCCVAYLIRNRDLHSIPDFVNIYREDFILETQIWLQNKGFYLARNPNLIPNVESSSYLIVVGQSPRDGQNCHAVVKQGTSLIYDPHPDETGIVSPIYDTYLITRLL